MASEHVLFNMCFFDFNGMLPSLIFHLPINVSKEREREREVFLPTWKAEQTLSCLRCCSMLSHERKTA